MFEKILKAANRYASGLAHVQSRQDQWLGMYERIRDHMKTIANYLNEHTAYKQGFYVDTLHAFNEGMRGACTRMPSLEFRSGPMPMPVTFRNSIGERLTYKEEGFAISITPTIAGQIVIVLQPHASDLDVETPEAITLGVVNEPSELSNELVEEVIEKGMQLAFYTSFTGMTEYDNSQEENTNIISAKRSPIGFKRHDTTEKV
jgi:hypothetical protein